MSGLRIAALEKDPGRYINLGDGSRVDNGIYVMLRIVLEHYVDAYHWGGCRNVDAQVDYASGTMSVRGDGRGTPKQALNWEFDGNLERAGMGDGLPYVPKKNDIDVCGVNALSAFLEVTSFLNGEFKKLRFEDNALVSDIGGSYDGPSGMLVCWNPSEKVFPMYAAKREHVIRCLNRFARDYPLLRVTLNGEVLSCGQLK